MGERKFMAKNSKCFTYRTAQITAQLLKLLPKWENSPGNPAPRLPTQPGEGTHCRHLLFTERSEPLVQVWPQRVTIPAILNRAFTNI